MSPMSPGEVKPMVDQTGLSGRWLDFNVDGNANAKRVMTVGPDGNIWFAAVNASGAPEIGRLKGTGTVSYFPTETGTGFVLGLAAGPDDDVWFTSLGGNDNTWKIGKMTTRGRIVFNETLPNGYGSQGDLAVGSDGDVWFALDGPGKAIGKSDPTGVVTIYRCRFCGASGLTHGPDGNIWFTHFTPFGIAKITPDGTITNYPAPANEVLGSAPAFGIDGRIWFSAVYMLNFTTIYQIGASDTNGAMSFYDIPDKRNNGANDLVVGPDGEIWYAQGRHIGRVSTSGSFQEPFFEPTSFGGGAISQLAIGPDDNAWFASGTIGVYVWLKMKAFPSSLKLTTGGAAGNLFIDESNYTHTLTAVSSDPTIATVSSIGRHKFSVAPVAAGSCKVIVSDDRTNSISIPVTVH
jgi:virginiamycin B lyase